MTRRDYLGPDSRRIQQMFAGIAPRYDFLNHFLSISVDRHWRRLAAAKVRDLVGVSPELCLDACCGTGDLTMAFGLRNLQDRSSGLNEIHRVLKPGGAAVILEFSKPVVPVFRQIFEFYFSHVLPLVGSVVSGDSKAYRYLHDSVREFPDQEELLEMMRK